MTRKLPWKQAERSLPSTPRSVASTPIQQVKVKRDESDIEDKKLGASSASVKRIKRSPSGSVTPSRLPRAGSTSPPPEPLPESYMVEGLENDDLYRMVEDEFISTAQQFTAHLHAAEYHRLKAASKTQNADTIRNISRPVVGRMTDLVKKKQDRKARLEKQKEATRKVMANKGQCDNDTGGKDDPWQSTSLYGLMEKPRQQATRLDNLTKPPTATRAAAGFNTARPSSSHAVPRPTLRSNLPGSKPATRPTPKEASETEDDSDDDLPVPSLNIRTKSNGKPSPSIAQLPEPREAESVPRNSLPLQHPARLAQLTAQNTESTPTTEVDDSDDSNGDFLARLKRRQEDRRRDRERRKLAASKAQTNSKQTTDDIIPGFL
ncbi:hypothetical protein F4776DRAFT_307877 [Hypoxylon sp. NC0597]|nr:hypothetical protein F4776DRAFT_307877 [Hypoxylon sp. NC0597]